MSYFLLVLFFWSKEGFSMQFSQAWSSLQIQAGLELVAFLISKAPKDVGTSDYKLQIDRIFNTFTWTNKNLCIFSRTWLQR